MKKIVFAILMLIMLAGASTIVRAQENELFDTKTAAAHTEKGIASLKDKKYDAAIKEFEESASVYPDAEAYYYLGYAYYLKGKTGDGESRKKSIESFEKAYELNPNFTPSKFKPAEPVEEPKQEKTAEPQPQAETEAPASRVYQAPARPTEPGKEEPVQPTPPVEPGTPPPAEQEKPR